MSKAKRTVAKAKNKAFQDLYERLEIKKGVNEVFRIAKQRNKHGQDVQQVEVVKSKGGEVLVEERGYSNDGGTILKICSTRKIREREESLALEI